MVDHDFIKLLKLEQNKITRGKMKTYEICFSEIASYCATIEAENEEEAIKNFREQIPDNVEGINDEFLGIDSVEEIR